MGDYNLNPDIFKVLKKKCQDEAMQNFLNDILLLEAENSNGWWFTRNYKDLIDEYVSDWEVKNENIEN